MKRALKFEPGDSVAVALEDLAAGDRIEAGGQARPYTVLDEVPVGHKVADRDIAEGGLIVKYGHAIGTASRAIRAGEHVHTHNVNDLVTDWRGKFAHEYDPAGVTEIADSFRLENPPPLTGYRRKNGAVGFRNYLLVLSTVVCANQPVEELQIKYRDIVCVQNPTGCVILPNEVERMKAVLLGLAKNPNVGAVIFVGLGCESVEAEWLCDRVRDEKPAAFVRCQSEGSTDEGFIKLERTALAMLEELKKQEREAVSLSDIRLGTECGASDWTTAAASNPAIGFASDLVVKNGGVSILGETCGWFGGEALLTGNARTRETADKIVALMSGIYDRALSVGRRIEEGNPTPGNRAGGITTLTEKALGNVKKGGTAPVEGVLAVGEAPPGPGLYVSDNPGLDPASVFALTCSGANIVVYSTGRGSPVGTPVAPVIKLTASPAAQAMFGKHNDVDLTGVVAGTQTPEEAGRALFDEIIAVANGKETIAERGRHREYTFPLLMGPL